MAVDRIVRVWDLASVFSEDKSKIAERPHKSSNGAELCRICSFLNGT